MEVNPIALSHKDDSSESKTNESIDESQSEQQSQNEEEIEHPPNEQRQQEDDVSNNLEYEDKNEDEDDEYDPESIYTEEESKREDEQEEQGDEEEHEEKTTEKEATPEAGQAFVEPAINEVDNHEPQYEEEEYDPEASLKDESTKEETPSDELEREPEPEPEPEPKKPSNSILKGKSPVGLPPKPPVNANITPLATSNDASTNPQDSQKQLKDAYEAVMQSEIVKDANFVNLPQSEQMKLIMEQLNKKNVNLTSSSPSKNHQMNYDQVYSYNKPFKNLKNPIPLVPVNEYCRRPNITAPMTPEEERAYDEFIKREAYYMKLQNWDEFPDKSRLFIGNLPANTISKQDLFRIFSQYGDVIQIAIKAGYGFAQFRTAEACLECIKGETNVPLHNKIMRLDASRPQKSRRPGRPDINNPNLGSRGRERSPNDSKRGRDDHESNSKRRKFIPDCQVYITGKSSVFFIRKVKKAFAAAQVTIDTEDVTHKDINEVISEAAYSGVLGTCVIKELKVDVQIFENTSDGGIKFDEYADIEPEVAADILVKAKYKKYGGNLPPYQPQSTSYQDNSAPSYGNVGGSNDYGYGNNRRKNDYQDNRRAGASGRYNDRRSGGNIPSNTGRGKSNYPTWPQYDNNQYGNQQYGNEQYGNQPYGNQYPNNQFANTYGQAPPNQYGSPQTTFSHHNSPAAPQQNDQANLFKTLQNLDPASMQSMISILQQQQQQQQPQQPPQNQTPYGNYNNPSYNQPPPPSNNPPNNQVNALLSQLQSTQSSSTYNPTPPPPPQQQSQNNSTQALMETLARLSRK